MSLDIKFSETIRPTSDFYLWVNENWIESNSIPNDFQKWSVFNILREKNREKEENILNNLTYSDNKENNSLKILYDQGLDLKSIERIRPEKYIEPFIELIDNCNKKELLELYCKLNIEYGVNTPIKFATSSDFNDSKFNILYLLTGGLGLPDRDYYFDSEKEDIRKNYKNFISEYSKLFNLNLNSDLIFNLEEKLASKTYTKVQKREPSRLNNPSNYQKISEKFDSIPIEFLFKNLKKNSDGKINISNPIFLDLYQELWKNVNVELWKDYLKWILILSLSNYINEEVAKKYFEFYGKEISGTPEIQPRSKRVISICNNQLGEVIGKLFVKEYFSESAKIKATELVDYIKLEIKNRLENNDWMESSTKLKGIEKLDKMNVKIGYPNFFEDYRKLELSLRNNYLQNNLLCLKFNMDLHWKKLYKEKNPEEWFMDPHMVNAYYSPTYNEIVFPAGILQEPFFSEDYDTPLNFGGIGTVIGHEITHGFDDKGRKFDSDGNLKDWWTEIDSKKYNEKTKKIRDQYSSYMVEGKNVNGDLTLGENIADIGGVSISYFALQRYLQENPSENILIDNLTPNQRFFINYAKIWRSKTRKKESLKRLTMDPHSPPEFRVNGVLSNLNEFYEAFNVNKNDKLWKPEYERNSIW